MQEKSTPSKIPTNKHHPKGLTILFEDQNIIVVNKIEGLLTMGTEREKERTAYFLLNDYVRRGNSRSKNRIFIVHRLDKDTSGVLIFAKSEEVKRHLQSNWAEVSKMYFAVVHGKPKEKEGVITSYLLENKAHRVYSTKDASTGKLSKTGYRVIKESKNFSLLEIDLFTGRKNQIRVHFSEMGNPVVGDKMYGVADKGVRRLALHAASITITHPFNQKQMTFTTELPSYFKALMNN